MTKNWCVYLLECRDGTFYTGITNRLDERIQAHNTGKGAKYTRGRSPVTLLESMVCTSQSEALKVELLIKALPRANKRLYFSQVQQDDVA